MSSIQRIVIPGEGNQDLKSAQATQKLSKQFNNPKQINISANSSTQLSLNCDHFQPTFYSLSSSSPPLNSWMFQQLSLADISSFYSPQQIQQLQQMLFNQPSSIPFSSQPLLNSSYPCDSYLSQILHLQKQQQFSQILQLSQQIEQCKASLQNHLQVQTQTLLQLLSPQFQSTPQLSSAYDNISSTLSPFSPIFLQDPNFPLQNLNLSQDSQKIPKINEELPTTSEAILIKQEGDSSIQYGSALQLSSSSSFQPRPSKLICELSSSKEEKDNTDNIKFAQNEKPSAVRKKLSKTNKSSSQDSNNANYLENEDDNSDSSAEDCQNQQNTHDPCSLEADIEFKKQPKTSKRVETAIDNRSRNFSKNLLKSFFKYTEQSNSEDKHFIFNFRRYTSRNKTNNQFIVKLLNHSSYSELFREFLGQPATDWINESKVQNIVEQVKFLEMCRDGTVGLLQKREYPKKKSIFTLKRK